MRKLNTRQRGVISGFFSTVAAAWFGAGIITTFFVHPDNPTEILYNILLGIGPAVFSLAIGVKIEETKR